MLILQAGSRANGRGTLLVLAPTVLGWASGLQFVSFLNSICCSGSPRAREKEEARGEGLSVIDLNCVPYLHVKKMGGGDEGDL